MADLNLENWTPMSIQKGPPLPRFLNIYWPWYTEEEEVPETPPEETPPEETPPEETPPAGAEFDMPPNMDVAVTGDGQILDMYWNCHVSLIITNRGTAAGTKNVRFWDSVNNYDQTISITLEPGQEYAFSHDQWVDFRRLSTYTVYARGDWSGNNESVGECKI